MTQYKALFLDVDGTILPPSDKIEESTKSAIKQIQAKGLEVFLATGRPLHEIDALAEALNIRSFIGYNGAFVKYQGEDIFQEPMETEIVTDFLEIISENGHEAIIYTHEKNVFTNLSDPFMQDFAKMFHLHKNHPYSSEYNSQVLGLTLLHVNDHEVGLYEKDTNIHLSQVNANGMQSCYDVIRDNVNKGIGIQKLLQRLEIPIDQAIAFGDGMNDKEMLQSVGEGFAMGNAHPDLFQYAKHKTTDVSNSGIYNGLKKLGLVD